MKKRNQRAGIAVVLVFCIIALTDCKKEKQVLSDSELEEYDELVQLKGGKFLIGTNEPNARDGEGPQRKVSVKPFNIMKYPVTNAAFRKFIRAKKFKTEAVKFQWSFVFEAFVKDEIKENITERIQNTPWWVPVPRAYWRQPEGPGSTITDRLHYPVTHVSFNDAKEYCQWKGLRLPTEPEWEFAARGGLENKKYPWGNKFEQKRMNVWQGKFPSENTMADGFHGNSPVDAFPPQNDYGMYDMVGNLWEWTTTKFQQGGKAPPGPDGDANTMYTLRGGSYIDSQDGAFNHMARVTTRMGNTPDAGSDNLGFRCASNYNADIGKPPSPPKKSEPSKTKDKSEDSKSKKDKKTEL